VHWVHLDKSICRGDGQGGLVAFKVDVGNVKLCLLGKCAIGKTALQFAVVVNGLLPVSGIPVILGGIQECLCCPICGLVFFTKNRTAAGKSDQSDKHRDDMKEFDHFAARSVCKPE